MTLIELLYHYRDLVREHGRTDANLLLGNLLGGSEESIFRSLEASVSHDGEFIDYEGKPFRPNR